MPGKSRHRRKRPSSKKSKARQHYEAIASQPPAVAQVPKPAAHTGVSVSPVTVPTPRATPSVARYPYITAELQRIGILTGIILIILIVLALVLS